MAGGGRQAHPPAIPLPRSPTAVSDTICWLWPLCAFYCFHPFDMLTLSFVFNLHRMPCDACCNMLACMKVSIGQCTFLICLLNVMQRLKLGSAFIAHMIA